MSSVAEFVLNYLRQTEPRITLETKLIDSWIDSLDLAELAQEVEYVYQIEIWGEISNLEAGSAVIDLVNLIQLKMKEA